MNSREPRVGWLPMEDGGEHESYLTTDYNAEMIEHRARFAALRAASSWRVATPAMDHIAVTSTISATA